MSKIIETYHFLIFLIHVFRVYLAASNSNDIVKWIQIRYSVDNDVSNIYDGITYDGVTITGGEDGLKIKYSTTTNIDMYQ